MGQFKPMVKMETTEPSVILKLKKGGHVSSEHKDADGHTNMKGKSFLSARAEEAAEEGSSPKKPSMSDRRKAMSGSLLMSKKGGKVEKKALGGPMGAPPAAGPMGAAQADPRKAAMLRAMMAKRAGAPAAPAMGAPAGGLPTMKKGGKAGAFAKTKMHDGDKADKASGTGSIKEGKTAGYKTGGTIEGNESKFANTKVDDGNRKDTAKGTGGVKEGQAGYKKGGSIDFENVE